MFRRRSNHSLDSSGAKYVFLHIPKAAGSAMKSAIAKSNRAKDFVCLGHNVGYSQLSRTQRQLKTFMIVRRPVSWYLSLYNFKMHGGGAEKYRVMKANSLEDFLDDLVFVRNGVDGIVRWNQPIERRLHVLEMAEEFVGSQAHKHIGFLTVNVLFYGSLHWKSILRDPSLRIRPDTLMADAIDVHRVLRQEYLQEDLDQMLEETAATIFMDERVNAMVANPYRDQIPSEIIAEIERRDRFVLDKFYRE
jgi:hypothetical protein